MFRKTLFVALLSLLTSSTTQAQIFLSFSDFGDGGAAANNVDNLTLGVDLNGSAFIWVDENYSIDTGAFLDVLNSNTGVIQFTGATVFNPDILVAGTIDVNDRWQSVGNQGVSPGLIDELNGFRVNVGTGILPSQATGNTFVDELHDPLSDAFLFAQVDFNVVGAGVADLSLRIGNGLIVNGGVQLFPNFGDAQVVVTNPIPEPTSMLVLAAGMVGICCRRRRAG
jgi:hypothetical protein